MMITFGPFTTMDYDAVQAGFADIEAMTGIVDHNEILLRAAKEWSARALKKDAAQRQRSSPSLKLLKA
jgi:hypothetical protein